MEKRHTSSPVPTQDDTNTEEMRIEVYMPSGIRIRIPSVQTVEDCSVYSCNAKYRQCRTTKHKIKTVVFLDVSLFSVGWPRIETGGGRL